MVFHLKNNECDSSRMITHVNSFMRINNLAWLDYMKAVMSISACNMHERFKYINIYLIKLVVYLPNFFVP